MIIIVGTTTVDLLIAGLERIPAAKGDEFALDNFAFCSEPPTITLGGNGANTAFVLSRLGEPATLCSAIGTDIWGGAVDRWLDDTRVATDLLKRSTTKATATTVVVADLNRNRQTFHHAGATAVFGIDDFPEDAFARAEVLLISGYQLLPGWRPAGMARALQQVRNSGALTLIDVGPVIDRPPTILELAPMLPEVDYLIGNGYELQVCTHSHDLERAAEILHDAGARTILAKKGSEGAAIYRRDGTVEEVAAFHVDVHSTVGAGDAFNAGLIAGTRKGVSLVEAVRYANATAALVVSSREGVLGAPNREAVERLVDGEITSSSSSRP